MRRLCSMPFSLFICIEGGKINQSLKMNYGFTFILHTNPVISFLLVNKGEPLLTAVPLNNCLQTTRDRDTKYSTLHIQGANYISLYLQAISYLIQIVNECKPLRSLISRLALYYFSFLSCSHEAYSSVRFSNYFLIGNIRRYSSEQGNKSYLAQGPTESNRLCSII